MSAETDTEHITVLRWQKPSHFEQRPEKPFLSVRVSHGKLRSLAAFRVRVHPREFAKSRAPLAVLLAFIMKETSYFLRISIINRVSTIREFGWRWAEAI